MSRYSKIIPGIWDDEKVRALSRPRPNAQTLWFYILTGPHITSLPGLWRFGPASAGEILRWDRRTVESFAHEVGGAGLAEFDLCARVVLVPGRFRHDPPTSPNVIMHWRTKYDELPDTPLKVKWLFLASEFMKGLNKGFQEAFAKAFGNTVAFTVTRSFPVAFPATSAAADPITTAATAVLPEADPAVDGLPTRTDISSTAEGQEQRQEQPPRGNSRQAFREWTEKERKRIAAESAHTKGSS